MKLSVAQTAELLGTSEAEVREWIRSRRLPTVRVQDQAFVHRGRLAEWARENGVAISPAVFPSSHPQADLGEAWRAGGMMRLEGGVSDLPGRLAALLPAGPAERASFAAILASRPDLGWLVDRDGIARPRLREPVVVAHGRPALHLLAFAPAHPLESGPVQRAFFLLSPSVAAHQHLLVELDAALSIPASRAAILRSSGPDLGDLLARPEAA